MAGWLGALPAAAFGGPKALGQLQTVAEPFQWGAGGRRMTPEDIALERRMAAQQMAQGADYSPLQHWTQGLARMSQGILGGLQMAEARKEARANAAAGDAVMQALLGGAGGDDVVARAMMDPTLPEPVRQFAELQYRQNHRPPPQPLEIERVLQLAGFQPGTPQYLAELQKYAANKVDPLMTIPTANGPYIMPRSQALTEGGGPVSGAPGASPPPALPDKPVGKLTPIGGPTPSASGRFP